MLHKGSLFLIAAVVVGTGLAAALRAQSPTSSPSPRPAGSIEVDWNDSALTALRSSARAGTAQSHPSLTAAESQRLRRLKLPVLAFTATPALVRDVLGPGAQASAARKVIFDAANPVWYQIVERYGDITITVDADLRVNIAGQSNFPIHQKSTARSDGSAAPAAPRISILDGTTEQGMEGVTAEYTVYRFPNIPYTVRIECIGAAKNQCRNRALIVQDQALLQPIAGSP
jgi:hypothetical protein